VNPEADHVEDVEEKEVGTQDTMGGGH